VYGDTYADAKLNQRLDSNAHQVSQCGGHALLRSTGVKGTTGPADLEGSRLEEFLSLVDNFHERLEPFLLDGCLVHARSIGIM